MTTRMHCPSCGAPLELVTDGAVGVEMCDTHGRTYHARERRPFLACSGCEFCADVRDLPELRGLSPRQIAAV